MRVDKGITKTTIRTESDKVGVTDLLLLCSRALYGCVFVTVHRQRNRCRHCIQLYAEVVCHIGRSLQKNRIFWKFVLCSVSLYTTVVIVM